MTRRFLLNLLAYVVPTFILGFLWHMKLFGPYYQVLGIYRADVIIPFGLLSMVCQGAVFAAAYPRLFGRPEALSSAMRFAALAALLSWTFTTLAVAAKHPMTSVAGFMAIETAFTIVQYLLVAPLLAVTSRDLAVRVPRTAS
jgi:hypothetical protein